MDRKSYDQLVREFTPMIHHMIKKLAIYKDKDEFMQMGLISIWEASGNFNQEKGGYSNYLYRHMRGRFLDELKKRGRQADRSAYPKDEFWDLLISPELYKEEEDYMRGLCYGLSKYETKWVIDTFIYQLTVREIAEKEQVSLSAVKWWKKGAKEKLKSRLKSYI